MPMERKTPIAYPDGVYEFAGRDRPNVLIIANLSQNGLTGLGSDVRTGFFIYFGMMFIIICLMYHIINSNFSFYLFTSKCIIKCINAYFFIRSTSC